MMAIDQQLGGDHLAVVRAMEYVGDNTRVGRIDIDRGDKQAVGIGKGRPDQCLPHPAAGSRDGDARGHRYLRNTSISFSHHER